MKKGLFLLILSVSFIASCGGGGSSSSGDGGSGSFDSNLVGIWTWQSTGGEPATSIATWTFSSDGLWTLSYEDCAVSGSFSTSNGILSGVLSSSTGGSCEQQEGNYSFSYSISGNNLTLIPDEGSETIVYTRSV